MVIAREAGDAGPWAIHDYVQAAEEAGYTHLVVFDHVLGADPTNRPGWQYYTHQQMFHEPFVLFGYLAALTNLERVTAVLILPQRQTVLVAKQAAQVDVLTGGRLRLGVGVGWNPVEYEALGMDFHSRGRAIEEQIEVLHLLWRQEIVSYKGNAGEPSAMAFLPEFLQHDLWYNRRRESVDRPDYEQGAETAW